MCQTLRLKCTKFDIRWGSTTPDYGSLERSPSPWLYLRGLLLRGRRGRWGGEAGKEEKEEGNGIGPGREEARHSKYFSLERSLVVSGVAV